MSLMCFLGEIWVVFRSFPGGARWVPGAFQVSSLWVPGELQVVLA